LSIDGEWIPTEPLDVDALYETGPMRKQRKQKDRERGVRAGSGPEWALHCGATRPVFGG